MNSSTPFAPVDQNALVSRSWNGTPISRRTTDGYVNATAMCKANSKQWNDYWRTDRATAYLEALCTETGIPVSSLCLSLRGGSHQGTWIHPQVAVALARWISAPFAVWMDGWFLESVQQAQPTPVETTPPRLREAEVIALVERSIVLFERLGGQDQRDELLFKGIVRSNVLSASSGQLLGAPSDEELTLGDAWLEVFQQALPRPAGRKLMETATTPTRQRVWVTTAEACTALGMSRETLRQLRLRGVLTPGKHYRRWGCTQGRGPLQWHLENVEATITGWSRRHLQH